MRFPPILSEVGAENNTAIVFPMPIELPSAFPKGSTNNGKSKQIKPKSESPNGASRHEPMLTADNVRAPK
jgi:hypothetical protein